ncbi:hypothetical protein VNO77_42375 [Canavalia gladiata]|uniref:Uncharacterized protein n=1 Tax=Canavalia gladiata TaxID=3824 RepID=A0AAN9PSP3_CANGL
MIFNEGLTMTECLVEVKGSGVLRLGKDITERADTVHSYLRVVNVQWTRLYPDSVPARLHEPFLFDNSSKKRALFGRTRETGSESQHAGQDASTRLSLPWEKPGKRNSGGSWLKVRNHS